MRNKVLAVIMLFVIGCIGCSVNNDKDVLSEEVTIIAPSSRGGGWDLTARAVQSTLESENVISENIRVINKIGAGGEVGWKFTKQQEDHVLAINSSLLITNHLLGQSKMTYNDFTPIATLATEWEAVVVPKDSTIKSAKSLMKTLKASSHAYKIGVSPRLGNDDQLSFVLASKQAGVLTEELDFYVYENSDQVVEALLNGQTDVATMSLLEAKKYADSGQVRLLVISSEQRLDEFPDVPTWSEEGIHLVFKHWRGIMGPPNMTKEEIKFWDLTIEKMVKTEKWKTMLDENMWTDFYKNSSETSKFLEEQSKLYKQLMGVDQQDS